MNAQEAVIQQNIPDLLRTIQSISTITSNKKQKLSMCLGYLYQQTPNAINQCKQFVSEILLSLKTITQDLDQISEKAQEFESLLVCPDIKNLANEEEMRIVDLSTPQKTIPVNQYQNMLKQQLFTEQTSKNKGLDYEEENVNWEERFKTINATINRCLEYAQKNI